METKLSSAVGQALSYVNQSGVEKKSPDKMAERSERRIESKIDDAGLGREDAHKVELSSPRLAVSESNLAASGTDIEDIDEVVKRIQEFKQWLNSGYEHSQIEQIHQLNGANLVEILS